MKTTTKKAGGSQARGHMALKSGPLAVTSSKLTSQYMVLDHMNVHYKKIMKAKPAIDNRPPKALQTSQRARDTVKRSGPNVPGRDLYKTKTLGRTSSAPPPYTDTLHDDQQYGDYDQETMVDTIVAETLRGGRDGGSNRATDHSSRQSPSRRGGGFVPADTVRQQLRQQQQEEEDLVNQIMLDTLGSHPRPAPAGYDHRTPAAPNGKRPTSAAGSVRSVATPRSARNGSADLLDQHSHKFKATSKPFTPRTLRNKTPVVSRLSQYKYYNPPPPKAKIRPASSELRQETLRARDEQRRPGGTSRGKHDTLAHTNGGLSTMEGAHLTLMSRDGNRVCRVNSPGVVPRLAITSDTDNAAWLQEQASKAELRRNLASTRREGGGTMLSTQGTLANTRGTYTTGGHVSQTLREEEEETKYVQFMNEVLTDVTNRGISTNRVLKRVFEQHIERRKHDLKVSKMRACLDKLRRDLDIPNTDLRHDDDDIGFGSPRAAGSRAHGADVTMETPGGLGTKKSFGGTSTFATVTQLSEEGADEYDGGHLANGLKSLKLEDDQDRSRGRGDESEMVDKYMAVLEEKDESQATSASDGPSFHRNSNQLLNTLSPAAMKTAMMGRGEEATLSEEEEEEDVSRSSGSRQRRRQRQRRDIPRPGLRDRSGGQEDRSSPPVPTPRSRTRPNDDFRAAGKNLGATSEDEIYSDEFEDNKPTNRQNGNQPDSEDDFF